VGAGKRRNVRRGPRDTSACWIDILRAVPALAPHEAVLIAPGTTSWLSCQKALHGYATRNPELIGLGMRLRTQLSGGRLQVWAERA
jgi:hypothetical protein